MDYLLKANKLTKKYKETMAVSSVDISLKEGCIYGLIGKNGAGKTTILKLISGLIKPTSGDIIFGNDISPANNQYFYSKIGALIESPGLYGNMTAFDNIKAKSLCLGKRCSAKEIKNLLSLVGLENTGRKRAKNFSLGMKQRLGIALALVGDPELLVLDEPINGLDPQGIVEVRNLIHKLSSERNITIIISSHILDELAKIATDICIIHNGKVLLEMPKEEFIELSGNMPIDEYYIKVIQGGC